MSDSTQIGLGIDASAATRGAEEFKRAGSTVIEASRQVEAAQIRIVESSARQGRALDAMTKRIDPMAQAVRDASRDLERLQRIAAGTGENAERAATLIAGAQAKLTAAQQAQATATGALSVQTDTLGKTAVNTSHAMRQLGIQSIDVFQQLASGAPVMTTFIQQGGQIGQVMAVTNTSIGSVARSIGAFVAANSTIIATTAALAGMGAAAYLVFQRSSDLAQQQRELSVAIAGVGRSADLSSSQLQGYVQRLKEQGVAVGDANKAVADLARNSGLSGGLIGRIVGLGPDAAAALGVSAPDAMAKLADAAKGSIDAIQKLSDAFNLLTPAQEASVREMIQAGDKAGALDVVFGRLETRVRGLDEQALSPAGKAMREMGNAWSSFIDRVANSEPVIRALATLSGMIRGLADLVTPSSRAADGGLADIDARIAAVSGTIPGTNARAAALRREQAAALERLYQQRQAAAQALSDVGEFGGGMPPAPAPSSVAPNAGVDLARAAAERVAGSEAGRIAALTTETTRFREALKALDPSVAGNRALIQQYTAAIKVNEDALAALTKKTGEHRTEVKRAEETAGERAAKVIEEARQVADAQQRISDAYDGTARSIQIATDLEKARASALKTGLEPGTAEYAETVERLNQAYTRGSDAASAFRHAQQSVAALTDMLSTAFDRLGQGIVDAFLSGRGAAVNFGNIARAVMASLLSDLARLSIVNPIRNAVFGGTPAATLGTAAGVLGGSGGGLFGSLGNVLSLGRITDTLGLTNIGGSLSNLFGFGEGGFFSGIGSSITSALNAPIFGSSALSGATNSALASLGGYGPATAAQVGIAGTTFGQLLGGFGLGFGAGSFGGGFLQSALGRTGPGPTIGAGVGALGGTVIGSLLGGPIVGGLLGGLLGGGGGAFFGPGRANAFSATGLNVGSDGLLSVGRTFSQIVDPTNEVNTLTQQIAQLNAVLSQFGARIANASSTDEFGQARLIGGRSGSWLNFGQGGGRPGDLTGAFGELRFRSDNPALAQLLSREFTGIEDLAQSLAEATAFLNDAAPALKVLASGETSFGVGTLATTVAEMNKQFDAAVAIAEKLGWAEYSLSEARANAIKAANDNVAREFNIFDRQLISRRLMAQGAVANDPNISLSGALIAFDLSADAQRKEFRDRLRSAFGDAIEQTEGFAVQMALLEETLGAERLATAKAYQDAIAAQSQQSAAAAISIVSSITDYIRSVTFGGESPLPLNDRYALASTQFNTTLQAARGGDAGALRNITSIAETFRSSSRAMFGSGAQYVSDTGRIFSALEEIASMAPETLTSAVFASETRNQTQTLVASLSELKGVLDQIRDETRRAANGPPIARAA